ncbi:MAG TPA: aminotransferase class I/II-fold pyridoxal phosphate-dependent enzyme [Candidatus Mediterraneibacter excrementigallinarum]|nr:aminotransferase class I/II-fold pyridoxal phosphate-dependent enzyme [Candidatus Mediterraneibacter excrementigallinarum]
MEYGHGGDIYTYRDMLDFSVNVNPLGPSREVIEAAKKGVERAAQYPDSRCRELRTALSEKKEIPGERFIFGNGAADLFFSLVLAEKPKRAVIPVPAFSEYAHALRTVDCRIEEYALRREEQFTLTEEFLECLTPEIDTVFLCSPSNPAGQVIEKELLCRIADRCEEAQIRLVVDECFIDFLPEPSQFTMEKLTERYPCLFVVQAFTKTHAIPGLRLGYGMSSDQKLLERMQQVRQPWSVSTPAQAAGLAALRDSDRVQEARELICRERSRMEEELRKAGVEVIPSKANFILMYSSYDLFSLLKDRGILIRDCSNYSGLGKGWYRTAVRRREENDRLLDAIRQICG